MTTNVIAETNKFQIVYDRLQGVVGFVRKIDDYQSDWLTGSDAKEVVDLVQAPLAVPERINEIATVYSDWPPVEYSKFVRKAAIEQLRLSEPMSVASAITIREIERGDRDNYLAHKLASRAVELMVEAMETFK